MPTWDNKAIKGSDLQVKVLTPIATEIKKKQDIIDAEFDNANSMIVLKNVEVAVSQQ